MIAAILLAAVGTWVLVTYVNNLEGKVIDEQEPVEILVAQEAIPQGTPVSEAAASFAIRPIPKTNVMFGALDSLDSLEGMVTSVDLLPGDQAVAARFTDPEELPGPGRLVEIPPGLLEVTVQLTPERTVGGSLQPGDLVAVISSFDPFTLDAVEPEDEADLNSFLNNDDQTETITLHTPNTTAITVHKALVTRVQIAQAAAEGTAESTADVAPQGSLLVTLAVQATDLEQIVFTAEYGSMWLARELEDTVEDDPVLIITRANVYR